MPYRHGEEYSVRPADRRRPGHRKDPPVIIPRREIPWGEILGEYRAGATIKALSAYYHVGTATISRKIEELGITQDYKELARAIRDEKTDNIPSNTIVMDDPESAMERANKRVEKVMEKHRASSESFLDDINTVREQIMKDPDLTTRDRAIQLSYLTRAFSLAINAQRLANNIVSKDDQDQVQGPKVIELDA